MSLTRALFRCGRMLARQPHVACRPMLSGAIRQCRQPLVAQFATKTKGDQELSTFLTEEIDAERKARKHASLPTIAGFDVVTKGSEVTLTRRFDDETVTVWMNVNGTVDADENPNPSGQPGENEVGEMLSKPDFDVTIERGGQKLFLHCSFVVDEGDQQQEGYDDVFNIVGFGTFTGESMQETDYTVSGDIMDAHLYDLLMNLLEERGITNEFAEQLVDFSTTYEHGLYIDLLEKLKNFVSK